MSDSEFSRLLSKRMKLMGIPYDDMRTILTGEYLAAVARRAHEQRTMAMKLSEEYVIDEYQTKLEDVRDVYSGGRRSCDGCGAGNDRGSQ